MPRNERAGGDSARSSTPPWSQLRTSYLTVYNLLFAALWASVGIRAASFAPRGKFVLFEALEPQARWVQTLTLIEVVHAAVGLVKSPVSTTAIQVFTPASHAFLVLVLAWSAADFIRYLYLTLNLHGRAPPALVWLRYTIFYPLYPVGICAEWWLMYKSIGPVGKVNALLPPIFYFLLALYIPGAYTMFTYMVKQRKKTLGRSQRKRSIPG
ncbi:PTPLA-domain-containing protein [Lizonia empirigonia]|nr:PTPLA-domain-containing protein [Lizonia empirigonia]